MGQIRKVLDNILNVLAGVSFIAMVVLTCWQVFTRYVMGDAATWTEELVTYLFAWMALLGASLVVGERGHMNIPLLVEKSSPSVRKALCILAEVIAAIFAAAILIYGGSKITMLAMGQTTASLGVAMGIFYTVMPISGVLNVIYSVINIIEILNGTINLEPTE